MVALQPNQDQIPRLDELLLMFLELPVGYLPGRCNVPLVHEWHRSRAGRPKRAAYYYVDVLFNSPIAVRNIKIRSHQCHQGLIRLFLYQKQRINTSFFDLYNGQPSDMHFFSVCLGLCNHIRGKTLTFQCCQSFGHINNLLLI